MTVHSLEEMFRKELFEIYDAEHQIVKALEKMAERASDSELADAFEEHRNQTQGQIERIERACEMLDIDLKRETSEAMEGLLEEGKKLMKECKKKGPVCDVAMIATIQKVEHYEIASYGTLCAIAKILGHDEAEKLLYQTLEEERDTDEILNRIAEGHVNEDAMRQAA